MCNILSFDLDGTLLNDNKEISQYSIETLSKRKKNGDILVVSTGRSYIGIPSCIKENGIFDYYITSNGASCVDSKGNYISTEWIDSKTILGLLKYDFIAVELLISGVWYMTTEDMKKVQNFVDDDTFEYIKRTRNTIDDINEFIDKNNYIEKINLNFSFDNEDIVTQIVSNYITLNPSLRCWTDKKHKIDVYNKNATKGQTITRLLQHLNKNRSCLIAFGDDDNDIELFKCADHSVAMCNGSDKLKEIADEITEYTNNEDGVAKFLNQGTI